MKKIVLLLLTFCMMISLFACGKETTDTKNEISTETPDAQSSAVTAAPAATEQPEEPEEKEIEFKAPGIEDIRAVGMEDKMQLPEDESYLSSAEDMYVSSSSANLYSYTQSGKSTVTGKLLLGDKVSVIAKQKTVSCVLCNVDGQDTAGWVLTEQLSYNNPAKTQKNVSPLDHSGQPGIINIRNCGQEKSITLPSDKEYFSAFDRMFVAAPTAWVYSRIEQNSSQTECKLIKGDEVNIIAAKDNLACVLMQTDSGEKAGWIYRDQLSYFNPDKTVKPRMAIDHSGTPDIAILEKLGMDKNITLPEEESYIACFDKMYTIPNVLQVFSINTHKNAVVESTLCSGSEVNVIAIQNKIALVLFDSDEGEKAGWVALNALSYHNPENDNNPTFTKAYSGTPSVKDIENLGLQKSMTLPREESYISSYDRMYVKPNVVKVFSFNENGYSNEICTLKSGSEVSFLAIQNHIACVLFESDEGTKAGWIDMDALFYSNPDKKAHVVGAAEHSGTPSMKTLEDMGLDKSITRPKDDSFLPSFERMYTILPTLTVFSHNESSFKNITFTLLKGSEVNVMALQNKLALILAETDEGEKAGWVTQDSLSYNDPDRTTQPTEVSRPSGRPGIKDIEECRMEKSMTLPDEDSYLDDYEELYTLTSTGALSFNDRKGSNQACTLAKGSKVIQIAKQNGYACILCRTDEGVKTLWVLQTMLTDKKPS